MSVGLSRFSHFMQSRTAVVPWEVYRRYTICISSYVLQLTPVTQPPQRFWIILTVVDVPLLQRLKEGWGNSVCGVLIHINWATLTNPQWHWSHEWCSVHYFCLREGWGWGLYCDVSSSDLVSSPLYQDWFPYWDKIRVVVFREREWTHRHVRALLYQSCMNLGLPCTKLVLPWKADQDSDLLTHWNIKGWLFDSPL
jgi:hypothetical protein